jgi:hypothetical protein
MVMPSSVTIGVCSITGEMILGYLLDSHLKAAGIPMLGRGYLGQKIKVGSYRWIISSNEQLSERARDAISRGRRFGSPRRRLNCTEYVKDLSPVGDILFDCKSEQIARTGKRLC